MSLAFSRVARDTRRVSVVCPNRCARLGDLVVRHGFFRRKFDGRRIRRYLCRVCRRSFSSTTGSPTFLQKKPYLNGEIAKLLSSLMSMRRVALHLGVDRKLVARRLVFLGSLSRRDQRRFLDRAIPGGAATTEAIAFSAGSPVTVMPSDANAATSLRSAPGRGKIMCLL